LCRISDGQRGRCKGRGRQNGLPVLFNYAKVVAAHLDPIEKKPLYHFFPGKPILSVGTFGCNLSCRFCQNCDISQRILEGETISPEELVHQAESIRGNVGVAFTYNEPGIWYEYVLDCSRLLREKGLKTILVTNGYLEKEPWKNLCSVSHAMNIDLKGFTEDFYKEICGGKLHHVLENIRTAFAAGVHIEITNLVVTGLNTDEKIFDKMVEWISEISPSIPFHISRYFPNFKESASPTDPEILDDFFKRARKKLKFVFVGNIQHPEGNDTKCPKCGKLWIIRRGYSVSKVWSEAVCSCGEKVEIVE